jgi:hypothetical protein
MPSLIYNSCLEELCKGNIIFGGTGVNTFKALLVTSAYTPDKDAHTNRSNITVGEVSTSGTNYTGGGNAAAPTVTKDVANDRVDISWSITNWTSATITARAVVIYKSTGTAASDLLVGYVDFGSDVTSTNGTFAVTVSTPLRFQN